jgi:hypothetical protein
MRPRLVTVFLCGDVITGRGVEWAGIRTAGAGNLREARRPAFVELAGGGRLIVFAFGSSVELAADGSLLLHWRGSSAEE